MAEKKKNSNSNNINLKFLINAQYLKDLSFENPQAPDSLKNVKSTPTFKIDADVKSKELKDHGKNIFGSNFQSSVKRNQKIQFYF